MSSRFAGAGASLLMVASRKGSKGGLQAPFGLGVVMLLLLPSEVAYEHLAELGTRALDDRRTRAKLGEVLVENRLRIGRRHHSRSEVRRGAAGWRVHRGARGLYARRRRLEERGHRRL